MVLPTVAPEPRSDVIYIYPVPTGITCEANDGNTWLPAPNDVVLVASNVDVDVLNVDDAEYQHLKLTRSPEA